MSRSLGDKVFTLGTHRVRPPDETWMIISGYLPRYGITRVADVTGLDIIGIPVAVAYRPLARTLSVSQGKGHTLLLAKISAVMEAVEMWHAEFACPPVVHRAVSATALHLPYALDQLDHHPGSLVHCASPLDWVSASGLISGRNMVVPRDCVQLKSRTGTEWKSPGLLVSSNGLASGNSFAEGAVHAVYEVMERDALSGLRSTPDDIRTNIRIDSIDDPICAPLIERIASSRVFLDVALVENRWNIPCFAAFVWSEDFALLTAGSGAHSSPSVALSRAITEAIQSRLTYIHGGRDDIDARYSHVLRGATARPQHDGQARDYPSVTAPYRQSFDNVETELAWASGQIAAMCGSEPMAVDLSTSDEFAVVKVICPGLFSSARHAIPRPNY
ncbi:YcaO-like family protein [Streptomyces sp. NPDC059003]|uniref:YcaO-like family protein n=1 Tax=Streptomyces sp. NPDC059003 TaxID=3346691 RepID=UPI0036885DEC